MDRKLDMSLLEIICKHRWKIETVGCCCEESEYPHFHGRCTICGVVHIWSVDAYQDHRSFTGPIGDADMNWRMYSLVEEVEE